jgi:hypothetical protein
MVDVDCNIRRIRDFHYHYSYRFQEEGEKLLLQSHMQFQIHVRKIIETWQKIL